MLTNTVASIEIGAIEYDTWTPHSQQERDSQQYGGPPAPAYALPPPLWVHGAPPESLLWNAALHVSCSRVSIYTVKHCGTMHPVYPVEESESTE